MTDIGHSHLELERRIITFGTFDCFHVGHVNILKRAKSLGSYLVVGVSTDTLNRRKGKSAIFSDADRLEIVSKCCYVDEVFYEESLEKKSEYITKYRADILVMGDDWKGAFDDMPCKVIYFERTPNISTTLIKTKLKDFNTNTYTHTHKIEDNNGAALIRTDNDMAISSQQMTALRVNCFCYNYTYLVPIVEILNGVGINVVFNYIRGLGDKSLLTSERFISYCRLKFDRPIIYRYIRFDEIPRLAGKNLGMIGFADSRSLTFGHGIDEEECIISLVNNNIDNNNGVNDNSNSNGKDNNNDDGVEHRFGINVDLLNVHRTIVNVEHNERLFNEIYEIDCNKPTIIFSDGYNCPFMITYITEFEMDQTDRILDILIELKNRYNVVIRFHPFMEDGYKLSDQFPSKLIDNFVVDFTPFNNFFLYTVADILITTRYTSSGYQSLFSGLEKIIFLDFDYDHRKSQFGPKYLSKIKNNKLEQWLDSGELISNHHINVINEKDLDQLYDTIINNKFHYNFEAIKALFETRYNIDYTALRYTDIDHSKVYKYLESILVETGG